MDLLPCTERDFTDPSYWKRFFEQSESAFEWYGNYEKLAGILEKYIKHRDEILQIGCGNSILAEELYDNGFRSVLSIDLDVNAIAKQKKRNVHRNSLEFENWSATELKLGPESKTVILDKGTLDALLPSESTQSDQQTVNKMFSEVERCLAPFGRYIVVTLAQQHILEHFCGHFGTAQFILRVHKCEQADPDFAMPVFVLMAQKLKQATGRRTEFHFYDGEGSSPERADTAEALMEKVRTAQRMNWFRHYISRGPVEETSINVGDPTGNVRFELTVVDDRSLKTLSKYGAFIVPFGRERDWLFATPKGRTILRRNCELHRLVVVRLSRGQHYGRLEQLQSELDPYVVDLRPRGFPIGRQINYLSLGATDVTEAVEQGESRISGKWTVEQVEINGAVYRRLVFLDSANLVQSEIPVRKCAGGRWQIIWVGGDQLSCEHHQHMLGALWLLHKPDGRPLMSSPTLSSSVLHTRIRFAVLGLGGGILAKCLHDTFPQTFIVGVELDPEVVDIAVKHFDFPRQSERLKVVVCDALDFLQETADSQDDEKFDIILVDLSGTVNEQGLYCPPPQFVTEAVLKLMRDSLATGGVLALNLVTRDDELAQEVKSRMSQIFASLFTIPGDEDINEVLLASTLPEEKFTYLSNKSAQSSENPNRKGKGTVKATKWLAKCLEEASSKLTRFKRVTE